MKHLQKPICFLLEISLIEFVKDKLPFFANPEDKIAKYWESQSRTEIIQKADKMFNEGKYMDVYEALNRMKYSKDFEVVWRLSRALYNLSLHTDLTSEIRKAMIGEAHNILESVNTIGNGQSNYHKWMAVISNAKNGFEGLEMKIKEYPNIRNHLIKACDSDPQDFAGRWHYEIANLTWFQRKIAKYLYTEPPDASHQEAYKYLNNAEELRPRSFIPNIYILGCACMKLGQYYRAKYYLNLTLGIPAHNECERCCASGAQNLLRKLEKYDLGKDLLYENPHFSFEN
ncbi:regulator of microtubule dynamics protein 1 isoform X2 [Dendroctonus ponderosae]|uniref:regulator of microtubule dynamics protein 1 isoform X2 n=1 Tax=Dendroctonus ponderosae TaxID=77166 RepID=UPI002034E002|nr:regulator of microtubule dynamics protein 1 isoform X2 [Dendroctonus ponderosae]